MNHRSYLLLAAPLAAFLLSGPGCAASKTPAEIEVRVRDTGAPVVGAEVWLQEGTTDGVFSGGIGKTDQFGAAIIAAPVDKDLSVQVLVYPATPCISSDGYLLPSAVYLDMSVPHPALAASGAWTEIKNWDFEGADTPKPPSPELPALEYRLLRTH